MTTDITIPPEVVEAAAKAMYMAEPWSTFWSIEDARSLCTAAIRAALENWPGMDAIMLPRMVKPGQFVPQNYIRLPLTEKQDD